VGQTWVSDHISSNLSVGGRPTLLPRLYKSLWQWDSGTIHLSSTNLDGQGTASIIPLVTSGSTAIAKPVFAGRPAEFLWYQAETCAWGEGLLFGPHHCQLPCGPQCISETTQVLTGVVTGTLKLLLLKSTDSSAWGNNPKYIWTQYWNTQVYKANINRYIRTNSLQHNNSQRLLCTTFSSVWITQTENQQRSYTVKLHPRPS
jgi:hypothetical protein